MAKLAMKARLAVERLFVWSSMLKDRRIQLGNGLCPGKKCYLNGKISVLGVRGIVRARENSSPTMNQRYWSFMSLSPNEQDHDFLVI